VIYSTFGTLTWSKKKYYFGAEKDVKKAFRAKNGIWGWTSGW
jgi:hypothetical protein